MKKVLLILVDALTARFLEPALERGDYPALQQLCENGRWKESCSIFPSITHAALTSLVTGKYPKDHGVLGSYWYLRDDDQIPYLGADPQTIWNEGINNFYEDFLENLNHVWLQSPTIFQQLAQEKRHATSLNHLVFRGEQPHPVNPPLLMELTPGLADGDEQTVMGPPALFLGDFVNETAVTDAGRAPIISGPQNWFGFKDKSTRAILLRLAEADALEDFTLAYFPENDFIAHAEGPAAAHEQLQAFDEMLADFFAINGGLAETLSQFAIIITGDHAQCNIRDQNPAIKLNQLLAPFQCAVDGNPWQEDDDLMICANLRAATLYFKEPQRAAMQQAVDRLRAESAIDQIICRADWLQPDQAGYFVLSERGDVRFWHGGDAQDAHGNPWGWEGELAAVDGRFDDGILHFGDYPNAFERLTGVLDSENSGEIWVTAVPGHEFTSGVRIHAGGGSHGSLHRLDSISPLITAGLPANVQAPAQPRLVDVAPLCQQILSTNDAAA